MSVNGNSPIDAMLAIIPFAGVQWALVWCVQYLVPLSIPRSLKAAGAALVGVAATVGIWVVQGKIYSAMTGIYLPAQDNYFVAIIIGECLISMFLGFAVALKLRKKMPHTGE